MFPRAVLLVSLVAGCAHGGPPLPNEEAEPKSSGSVMTAEEIERAPRRPIEEVLASRFPGVTVVRLPNGELSIRIRGTTSINARTEPLYVIDGIPIEAGPGGALSGINPYDIESIEVLKDAASTTMYGVRGANGVIIIKTKQRDR